MPDTKHGQSALPDGWCWTQLGDVADVYMGNSPRGASYNREGRGLPLLNGPTEFGPRPFDHPKAVQYTSDPTRLCEPGDLLVCVRGSTGRTNIASFQAAIGRDIAAVRCRECQPYINHYVASQATRLRSIGTGSTLSGISLGQLRALSVPLPPISDQLHIVTAIEEALAEIDAGTDALERARAGLDELRASVLRDAVTGKLTEPVRQASTAPESAREFLARVLARRDSIGSSATGGHANLSETEEVRRPVGPNAPTLPEGWVWTNFAQLCEIQLGRQKSPANRPNRYPTKYIRAANITDVGLDLSDLLEMDFEPADRERFRLRPGDLIVAEASGSPEKVGKPKTFASS